MSSKYFKELDEASKARYTEKLTYSGESLPDPLDEAIRQYAFIRNVQLWPSVGFGDIYIYLVERECSYTKERFKNYKGLDSYNYFLSGKVLNILAFRNKSLNICVLTCDVQASQSIKTYHKPWIVTSTNGVVHSGHCTCMAGLGEVCSHVAALLFALEVNTREGSLSATSVPCLWNKCVKKVEPSAAIDINFTRKRVIRNKTPCVPLQMPSESAYDAFLEIIKNNQPDAPILSMLSDDEDASTVSDFEDEPENEIFPSDASLSEANMPNLIMFYQKLYMTIPRNMDTDEKLDILIERSVFTPEYITNVEYSTRKQTESPQWFHYRKGRITASLFGRVMKCTRGHTNLVKTILQEKEPFSSNAMKYGQLAEEFAKKKLHEYLEERHVNAEVLSTGLKIDEEYGFLGASPDCMVLCDCCNLSLVEIKCPARCIGTGLKDIEKKNFFLDDELNLKRNHNYYDQVQGQLAIWNIPRCFFVTYTDVETNVEIIDLDADYWIEHKGKLVNFFKIYVLPEILKNISNE